MHRFHQWAPGVPLYSITHDRGKKRYSREGLMSVPWQHLLGLRRLPVIHNLRVFTREIDYLDVKLRVNKNTLGTHLRFLFVFMLTLRTLAQVKKKKYFKEKRGTYSTARTAGRRENETFILPNIIESSKPCCCRDRYPLVANFALPPNKERAN